jgi:hypothetical protein
MSSNLDAVVAALTAEFDLEVVFVSSLPSTLTAPSVVVAPSDPFLEPSTIAPGFVEEQWDVLAVVSWAEQAPGLDQMRNLSLRVRRAVSGAGGSWRGSSGPRRMATETSSLVFSVNTVVIKYDPAQHLT